MSIDEPSLARLMAASQRGDRSAYRALLVDSRKWLERYFARRIAPHHIDDLVQETLVSMHRKLATWDSGRAFLPWLAAIARYRWIDMLRRQRDEAELGDNDAAVGAEDRPSADAAASGTGTGDHVGEDRGRFDRRSVTDLGAERIAR